MKHPHLIPLQEALKKGETLLIEELFDSPKALLCALALEMTGKNILFLSGKSREEGKLFHDLSYFRDTPVLDFPAWETLPSENIAPSSDIVGERYETLEKARQSTSPHLILTTLQAVLQKLIPPADFRDLSLTLEKGEPAGFQSLIDQLELMGYKRVPVASDKGEYAVRGGILDVFPVSTPDPYRIEFFGDDVESIRIYDPIGQKSIKQVERLVIIPARELELLEIATHLSSVLEYLGPNTLIILDDLVALEDRYASLKASMEYASPHLLGLEEFLDLLEPLQKIYLTPSSIETMTTFQRLEKPEGRVPYSISFEMFGRTLYAKRWHSPFQSLPSYLNLEEGFTEEEFFETLKSTERKEEAWTFIFSSDLEKTAFQKKLFDRSIFLPPDHELAMGYLSSGFVIGRSVFFPLTELTHRLKLRRQKHRSTYHTPPTESFELHPGDVVVHLNHGIGKYLGMENRPNHLGTTSEFFLLEYANSSKLYVPLNQAHLITKYIGSSEETPRMHEIGSSKWKRAKEKTQQAIMGYAAELLELYAKRSVAGGFSFKEDGDLMQQFESAFPYEETKDQIDAIGAVKQDMCSSKSMDRLICGDVGYGKTEVAMRAAFKAVVDGGKQVALLVPTTVLATQHYENFMERMQNFPVHIGVLSRFQTAKETKETIEKVKNGEIDILIGTHRIISDDIIFKDLGLIIIDEEQRFGVKAKEHLKKVKVGVETLTLSATPIPRTLYMSLMGARDLSVINTPPQDRLPIKTVITQLDDALLKNALLRELSRDGQAFVIHNRVDTIYNLATRIKSVLPQARVIVGHGQMNGHELDQVFHKFKSGEVDILVATSIIENGIDIPHANTIIVDRADLFGIADLYQIRGRVGRWNRQAYCYFTVPNLTLIPEITRKRLHALAESSGYGGGMKVALRDLEIRGAGNVLGTEQSGQVEAIGFHQYCRWLKRAVQTLQGDQTANLLDAKVECSIDARLPENYVNEVSLRMEFYQRLGEAHTLDSIDIIHAELLDRFGPLPEPAAWLMSLSRVKVFATLNRYTAVSLAKTSLSLERENKTFQLLFKAPTTPKEWEDKLLQILKERAI